MNKKNKKPEHDFIDISTAASVTECTGIVAAAPKSDDGLENRLNIMKFSPKNIVEKK